jgi:hypothetical protein
MATANPDTQQYSLTIREKTGARLLIGVADSDTTKEAGIIISRDRIADCIRAQISKISDEIKYKYDLCYYPRYLQIHSIDNRLAADALGSVIDWTTFDFTGPIASVLMTQPDAPFFKRVEFYFRAIMVNEF